MKNKREVMETLEKNGIRNGADLNEAIRKEKPVAIFLMTGTIDKERKAS